MPNTRFHIGVADLAADMTHIANMADFYIGNVFPDAPWIPYKAPLKQGVRAQLHEYKFISGVIISLADPHTWIIKHAKEVSESDFMKGWFLHLLLDVNSNLLWNMRTKYTEFDRAENKDMRDMYCDWNELAEAKWKDVQHYSEIRFPTFSAMTNDVRPWLSKKCFNQLLDYQLIEADIEKICTNIRDDTRYIDSTELTTKIVVPQSITKCVIDVTLSEFTNFMQMIQA